MQLRLALSGLVADSMLKGLDADKNKKFDWKEFKAAATKLMDESETA